MRGQHHHDYEERMGRSFCWTVHATMSLSICHIVHSAVHPKRAYSSISKGKGYSLMQEMHATSHNKASNWL